MNEQTRVRNSGQGLPLFLALAWVSSWWAFTLSLGWAIANQWFPSEPLEPVSSLAARLF